MFRSKKIKDLDLNTLESSLHSGQNLTFIFLSGARGSKEEAVVNSDVDEQ